MNVPGSNLLNQALSLIAAQTLIYKAFVSRSTTSIGTIVPTYAAPVSVRGSIQPVPRTLMEILGLDMQRSYVNIFVPQNVVDVGRDVSSDQFQFNGVIYQCISATAWSAIDGWTQILSVAVPNVG